MSPDDLQILRNILPQQSNGLPRGAPTRSDNATADPADAPEIFKDSLVDHKLYSFSSPPY